MTFAGRGFAPARQGQIVSSALRRWDLPRIIEMIRLRDIKIVFVVKIGFAEITILHPLKRWRMVISVLGLSGVNKSPFHTPVQYNDKRNIMML